MSASEVNRIRLRVDALEAMMERMVQVMDKIEGMYDTIQTRHEIMMQEKANIVRSGTLAEIKANMSVVQRELLADVKRLIQAEINK